MTRVDPEKRGRTTRGSDRDEARRLVAEIDFFETAFGVPDEDQPALHRHVIARLLDEVHSWHDEPVGANDPSGGGGGRSSR